MTGRLFRNPPQFPTVRSGDEGGKGRCVSAEHAMLRFCRKIVHFLMDCKLHVGRDSRRVEAPALILFPHRPATLCCGLAGILTLRVAGRVSYPSGQTRPTPAGRRGGVGPSPTPDTDGFDTSTELSAGGLTAGARIAALKQALHSQEEYLQTANEELESSSEELKSSNEEMQSVNEELQSTNEELETSKEELQSVNEELATVNAELQIKVTDLSRANNDMNNLLAGTGIGTVFVDHQLRILRFTPAASTLINLILSDIGRPIAHVVSNLVNYSSLVEDLQAVLNTLVAKEMVVLTKEGKSYTMRIQPYRTLENVIEGAVISFVDITELKQAQEAAHQADNLLRLAVVVHDAQDAITMQDMDGRILAWNPGAVRLYGWSEAEALQMNVRDRIPSESREKALAKLVQLSKAQILEPYLTQRLTKQGPVVVISITSTALVNSAGHMYAVATTERVIPGEKT